MPHTTSLADCLLIIVASLAIAAVRYVVGRNGGFSRAEARQLSEYYARRHPDRAIGAEDVSRAVGQFYRGPSSFLIFWLPWLLYGAGLIGVSLLRDAGFEIFPWPIAFTAILLGMGQFFAGVLKVRCLSQLVTHE